jgi:hypothetical protein
MPGIGHFLPVSQKKSKVLYWASVPLMLVWVVGFYLFSPFYLLAAGNWAAVLFTVLLCLGPGVLPALLGMWFPRVRHAECDNCGYSVDVRAPNVFGIG